METAVEDIVIAGAGLAGLATALGLHRKGVRSLVLESSPELRSSGFAFTTWTNAFRALDALGVGDKIREHHLLYERRGCSKSEPEDARKKWAARDPVREAELPPGHAHERAAGGHHQVLLQDRRHRGGRRRESPALGRRRHHKSQGPDRMRRRELRGGEMAGPSEAHPLGALGHPGPRRLPGRPRLRPGDPAVHRPRLPLRRAALLRHVRVLELHLVPVPIRRGRRGERGQDAEPRARQAACRQADPGRGAGRDRAERDERRRVVTAAVPLAAVPRPRHHQPARRLRGRRRAPPHDARAGAGRVRRARGRRRPGALPRRRLRRRQGRGRRGTGEVRGGEAVARHPAHHGGLRRRLRPAEQQRRGQVPQGEVPVRSAGQGAGRHGGLRLRDAMILRK